MIEGKTVAMYRLMKEILLRTGGHVAGTRVLTVSEHGKKDETISWEIICAVNPALLSQGDTSSDLKHMK
jgi:hypothetical protein